METLNADNSVVIFYERGEKRGSRYRRIYDQVAGGGGLLLNRKKKDMIFFLLNRSGRKGGVADVGERRNTCKCKVFEWAKVERIKTA